MIQGLKLRRFLTTILLFAVCTLSWAYDFVADDIYYNINSDGSSVSVTYKNNRYYGVVNIPSSVLYDGKQYSVTSIGSSAFDGCSSLTSVTIPTSVTSIGSSAFYGCSNLTSITIPNSVTSIGSSAFQSCSSLASIAIPNSVTNIGSSAFDETLWYSNQPDGLVYAGKVAYHYKGTMTEGTHIELKEGTLEIAEAAFYNCSGLTSISFPNSLTSIGDYAFYGCLVLETINIPNSVTSIGSSAFSETLWYNNQPDGLVYAGKVAYKYKGTMPEGTEIIIKNGTLGITEYAFYECTGITSITMPNSVRSIGEKAFYKCSNLTSVNMSNSVTCIGDRAFCYCSSLKSITIPNKITTIGNKTFGKCTELISVIIPSSVRSIDREAFSSCTSLTSVTIDSNDIVSAAYTSDSNIGTIFGSQVEKYILGDDITSIGHYAFENCSSLTSIAIPNSVTSIGDHAFQYCSSLTSIAIPNSVKSIGISAFENCSNLTSITIPNSVTSIGKSVFEECFSLASVILPNGITNIGSEFFNYCKNLTSVTIPNSVINIAHEAFDGCSSLTSVTIPNSVIFIEDQAFSGCTSLASIKIGNGVTNIGEWAFENCSNLKEVYCLAEQVPETDLNAFYNSSITSATLFVPASVVDTYKATAPWSDFGKIMPLPYDFESDGIYYKINIDETSVTVYSIGNISSASLVIPSTVTYSGKQYIITSIGDGAIPSNTQIYVNKGASALIAVWNYGRSPYDLSTNTLLPIPTISKTNNCSSSLQLLGSSSSNGIQFTNESFILDGVTKTGHTVKFTGLNPNSGYDIQYKATVKYGGESSTYTIQDNLSTSALVLTLSTPKVISLGNVIVAATSNMDDEEETAGFEWRRLDWPDEISSNSGIAYLYEGTMEGYIRNLNTNYYWKVRPYYKSNDGTYYYGEWGGFDPTNTSYFEPTVHTYAKINVTGNKAQVSGYVQRASDAVSKQGFKYWVQEDNARGAGIIIPSGAKTVEAEGRVMEVELTGLKPNTTYAYVAFVTTTEGETFYGKQLSFTTGDDPDATIVGDANCNGEVEIGDVTSVLTLMATPEATGYDKKAADANGNGEIEIGDVTMILTIMANGE